MTQCEIDAAVARALGEETSTISGMGFSLIEPGTPFVDDECDGQEPQVIDWDAPLFGSQVQSFYEVAA